MLEIWAHDGIARALHLGAESANWLTKHTVPLCGSNGINTILGHFLISCRMNGTRQGASFNRAQSR